MHSFQILNNVLTPQPYPLGSSVFSKGFGDSLMNSRSPWKQGANEQNSRSPLEPLAGFDHLTNK